MVFIMKITTECVYCLLNRIIYETELSTKDVELRTEVIKKACGMLSEIYSPDECSASIATRVHKLAYETLGDNDPYKELKDESNNIAKSLVPLVEELVNNSDNPLKMSMICAIIGNMMDFGIAGGSSHPGMLKEVFGKTVKEGLGYDDFSKVEVLLKKASHVVLFTDNCGEIVFDKVLCRELKKAYPNCFLTLVVRGAPIISDATIEDARAFGFDEVVDEILTTNCFAIGVDFNSLSDRLRAVLDKVDLIICKGMANYEAFSETDYKPIAYLLRTKCAPIANSMGIPQDINAIKLYE